MAVDRPLTAEQLEEVNDLSTHAFILRDASNHFHMGPQFQDRFRPWVRAYITRPAFIRRLRESNFGF
jgi:hypothetical protein